MTPKNRSNNVELKFVQFDGPNDPSKAAKRSSIRAHVMKRYHRDRRAQARLNLQSNDQEDLGPNDGCEASNAAQRAAFQVAYRLAQSPCRPLTQPHSSHPLIVQHIDFIEMCCSKLSSQPQLSPFTTHWFPASAACPALFYASLFVCSASFETLTHKTLSATSYINRGRAIQSINAGLSDPIIQKTDEVVAAVISLANFECITGNVDALKQHVGGLSRLVRIRGGLEQLGMKGLLSKLISLYSWFLEILCRCPSYPETPRYLTVLPEAPTLCQAFALSNERDVLQSESGLVIGGLRILYEQLASSSGYGTSSKCDVHVSQDRESNAFLEMNRLIWLACSTANEIWASRRRNTSPVSGFQFPEHFYGAYS